MAENKAPSFFHLYLDYDEQFRMLSDAQAGMLIKALFSYANDGEEPDFDDLTVKLLQLAMAHDGYWEPDEITGIKTPEFRQRIVEYAEDVAGC